MVAFPNEIDICRVTLSPCEIPRDSVLIDISPIKDDPLNSQPTLSYNLTAVLYQRSLSGAGLSSVNVCCGATTYVKVEPSGSSEVLKWVTLSRQQGSLTSSAGHAGMFLIWTGYGCPSLDGADPAQIDSPAVGVSILSGQSSATLTPTAGFARSGGATYYLGIQPGLTASATVSLSVGFGGGGSGSGFQHGYDYSSASNNALPSRYLLACVSILTVLLVGLQQRR
jgi:hypothetical protein